MPGHEEDEQLLAAALDLGENLLGCGGEVSRVEDTIHRVCMAYGASRTDVFAITSSIVVTMERAGRISTQTRRISGGNMNFTRLERLNALSREICRNLPPISALREEVRTQCIGDNESILLQVAGSVLASSAFCIFFGGGLRDALCSAFCALLVVAADRHVRPLLPNALVYTLLCSILTGLAALLCGFFGLCGQTDKVMIGDIMLLIPGIALTSALRDLFRGDTISGMLRLLEALLQAVVIACGFALAVYLGGMLR